MDTSKLANLRKDYQASSLDVTDVEDLPINQFKKWINEALNANVPEPNAMILGTSNKQGKVSQRTVLLKGLCSDGFIFYTNYDSQKGKELAENPQAGLLFLWLELQRQVRIEGRIEKIDAAASTKYFQSRPRGSQIGAWASPQSSVIPNRETLEAQVEAIKSKFKDQEVLPRPPHWGGYILHPEKMEFWQGRSSRLHDRVLYQRAANGQWNIERLAP